MIGNIYEVVVVWYSELYGSAATECNVGPWAGETDSASVDGDMAAPVEACHCCGEGRGGVVVLADVGKCWWSAVVV